MNNISIDKKKFNINFIFYNFLKILNSNDGLTKSQLTKTFEIINNAKDFNTFLQIFEKQILSKIDSEQKQIILNELLLTITDELVYKVFVLSIYILIFKPLLMDYAKLIELDSMLEDVPLLSLKRDNLTKNIPWSYRVNGALICLVFFDFVEKKDQAQFPTGEYKDGFIGKLFQVYEELKVNELEANQIFMIVFQESISQSGRAGAGSNLEELVTTLLLNEGIKNIDKRIDQANHEIEYDHFFILENKKYGISTKRTLRERYKQFKKVKNAEADIFIHITSGLDLNEEKSKTITSNSFGCYIFVFPEIYNNSPYMKNNSRVFSTEELNFKTLISLS